MNLFMKFPGGRSKALTLSFDDGHVFDIPMVEILDRYGIKCTFNVNSGRFLDSAEERPEFKGAMTREEAKKLYASSCHEVACHTVTHPFLEKLRSDEIVYEVLEDRKRLEQDFGVVVKGMAYPYGTYSQKVIDALKACGIVYSRTTKNTRSFKLPESFLEWHPTCHQNDPELMTLAKTFVEKPPKRLVENQLFYLWGHSFEFDRDGTWDLLEKFCRLCGGREEIWYCTNMEYYSYVKAFESLAAGVENNVVYNPTATDLYFIKNKKHCCIRGGETLRLD